MRIALTYPDDHSLWLFRKGLIRRLVSEGHEVWLVSAPGEYVPGLEQLGARHHAVAFGRFVSPIADLRSILAMAAFFRRMRFDIVHNSTVKPNLLGALAARLAGVPCILNTVEGLGVLAEDPSSPRRRSPLFAWILHAWYRLVSRIAARTWFLNPDDVHYFVSKNLISPARAVLIRSTGVDLDEWMAKPGDASLRNETRAGLGIPPDAPVVLMVSRAIKPKGIEEFYRAAKIVSAALPSSRFLLAGGVDEGGGVDEKTLKEWGGGTYFTWLGHRNDVRDLMAASDVVALPSYYREGVPRCLLEAMALQLPIVTTDHVGCKETVDEGMNGFKVPVKDPDALASAILRLLENPPLRRKLGDEGRKKAVRDFSETKVVEELLRKLYCFGPPAESADSRSASTLQS